MAIVTDFNTKTKIKTHNFIVIKVNQNHVQVKLFYHQMEQLSRKVTTAANCQMFNIKTKHWKKYKNIYKQVESSK